LGENDVSDLFNTGIVLHTIDFEHPKIVRLSSVTSDLERSLILVRFYAETPQEGLRNSDPFNPSLRSMIIPIWGLNVIELGLPSRL
jgi:hypothetical protein